MLTEALCPLSNIIKLLGYSREDINFPWIVLFSALRNLELGGLTWQTMLMYTSLCFLLFSTLYVSGL